MTYRDDFETLKNKCRAAEQAVRYFLHRLGDRPRTHADALALQKLQRQRANLLRQYPRLELVRTSGE